MGTSDNFCLRWNDFETNISTSFRELRRDSEFFDVTLCCDNGSDRVPAHKVILAACSPLFRRILHGVNASSSPNPLLYLKGIQKKELTAILNFMYHGEVNVAQDSLNAFLAVAEELAVKGLTTDSKPEGFAGSAHATSSAGGGAAASAAVDDPSDPDYSATGSSKKRPVKKTPASAAKLARKRPDDDDDDGGDVKRVKAEPDVMIPDDDEGVAGGSGVGGAGAGPDFGDDEFGGGGGEGFDDSYGGYDDLEDNGGLDTTGGAGGGGEVTKELLQGLSFGSKEMQPPTLKHELQPKKNRSQPQKSRKSRPQPQQHILPLPKPQLQPPALQEEKQPQNRRYAMNKLQTLMFTEEFDLNESVEIACLVVKRILEIGDLNISGEADDMRFNTRTFFKWLLDPYYKAFQKHFGFTMETREAKMWPGQEVANILIKKLERISPGLTRTYDPEVGAYVPKRLCKMLSVKLLNDNKERMRKLRSEQKVLDNAERIVLV